MEPRASSGAEEVKSGSRYVKNARRREYEEWFKAQVVEECHRPGASVSIVARRHDINANVLFRRRREYRLGILKPAPRPERNEAFVSVGVIGDDGKLMPEQAHPDLGLSFTTFAAATIKRESLRSDWLMGRYVAEIH